MHRRPRILIADSHRLFAEACKQLLEPEFEVVEIVTDGRALVASALRLKPDGAILEVGLPKLNGLAAAETILRKLPSFKLVFATANSDPATAAEAFRCGGSAYVLKQAGAAEFITAVRGVLQGQFYLSSHIARETIGFLLHSVKQSEAHRITLRQTEILQLLAEGRSMKTVADILGIAAGTVAFHKYQMMEKLGIESTAELLQYAIRHRMAPSREDWTMLKANEAGAMELLGTTSDFGGVELVTSAVRQYSIRAVPC